LRFCESEDSTQNEALRLSTSVRRTAQSYAMCESHLVVIRASSSFPAHTYHTPNSELRSTAATDLHTLQWESWVVRSVSSKADVCDDPKFLKFEGIVDDAIVGAVRSILETTTPPKSFSNGSISGFP
jgi:hypothetical protein